MALRCSKEIEATACHDILMKNNTTKVSATAYEAVRILKEITMRARRWANSYLSVK